MIIAFMQDHEFYDGKPLPAARYTTWLKVYVPHHFRTDGKTIREYLDHELDGIVKVDGRSRMVMTEDGFSFVRIGTCGMVTHRQAEKYLRKFCWHNRDKVVCGSFMRVYNPYWGKPKIGRGDIPKLEKKAEAYDKLCRRLCARSKNPIIRFWRWLNKRKYA